MRINVTYLENMEKKITYLSFYNKEPKNKSLKNKNNQKFFKKESQKIIYFYFLDVHLNYPNLLKF